jgi:hypothetical protein
LVPLNFGKVSKQKPAATEQSAVIPSEPQTLAEELESKCREADPTSPDMLCITPRDELRGCTVPTDLIARPRQRIRWLSGYDAPKMRRHVTET